MTTMRDLLARVVADLRSLNARHAIVGGHAVSARTEPRFTRDLDFAVATADDQQAEWLAGALAARGYRIIAVIEQEATGRLATVRFEHPSTPGVLIDLLFATAGIEPEVVADATPLTHLADLAVPVASVGHLLALKTLSVDEHKRPQDRIDLLALFSVAKPADLEVAEHALSLITQRGFHRGRDLVTMFADLRSEATS